MTRIFQAVPLTPQTTLLLDRAASHHLAGVLRAKPGDRVTLFNGTGGEFSAHIRTVQKNGVTVQLENFLARETESALSIFLAPGISRGEKMDYMLQKSVELGVKKIFPLITDYCNVRLQQERSEKKIQHWQKILQGACEQCGRNQIPELAPPQTFSALLDHLPAHDHALLFSPQAETTLRSQKIAQDARVLILTGPEGGLSKKEIDAAREKKFTLLALGPRILRTETAAIAAITALQCFAGDMG